MVRGNLPLAFAYQMTGDTKYSNKLIELAQEMIRAQSDPDNNPPTGQPPIRLDSYYASRGVASTLAFIYDYCYDQLSASLKQQMVTLMNDYYDDVSVNGYQAQNFSNAADGNYFGGHLYGVALMGYASFGDKEKRYAISLYSSRMTSSFFLTSIVHIPNHQIRCRTGPAGFEERCVPAPSRCGVLRDGCAHSLTEFFLIVRARSGSRLNSRLSLAST